MRITREILRLFLRMIDALFITENLFFTYLDPLSRFMAIAELSKINLLIYYKILCVYCSHLSILFIFNILYIYSLHPLQPLHLFLLQATFQHRQYAFLC
jgi:hypothetical protein